jgi:polysaccharide chain length determinant protein (PEP-CTERM system associated)
MLPGKKYTPEDGLAILRRRLWWLLVPMAAVAAGAAVYARLQPNLFRSQARILMAKQRVPESYVRSTVTTRIEERLSAISQQVLTRANLEQIIEEFNLYPDERRTGIMEEIYLQMRQRDIRVTPDRAEAFTISYTGADPRTVMRVTERLGNLFINESIKDRQIQADGTNDFLESQLREAKDRLIEHEKKLQAYKERYAGQLPNQADGNMRSALSVQTQAQVILDQISRDQERRMQIEREISDLELQLMEPPPPATATAPPTDPATLAAAPLVDQLVAAQRDLAAMELKGRRAGHPDHQRQMKLIRDLEAKIDAAMLEAPVSTGSPTPVPSGPRPSAAELARRRRIQELRDDIKTIDRRVADNQYKEQELRVAAAEYQRRAEAGPSRESEFVELTRDYGALQQLYNGLLQNREQARVAANLVTNEIGERFKMLDPPTLPIRPLSPDRQMIALIGLLGGLALGFCCVVLLEYRDLSLKTDEDVSTVLSLPVLAVVPFMRSRRDQRLARSRRVVVHAALAASVLGCFAVLALTLLS